MTAVALTGLKHVRTEIARACRDANRDPSEVTLIAVSKMFTADAIEPAIAEGQRVFGENRVQEAKAKWPQLLEKHGGLELHLIGSLQSNKGGGCQPVRRYTLRRSHRFMRSLGKGNRQAETSADFIC